jgi:phosphoribosylanthranilate isomerase
VTWVKVCGLRTPDDVEAAVKGGADAVGFVLAPDSPRSVAASIVHELATGVPILSVIVTVDSTPEQLMQAVEVTGVGGVQPHGRHQAEAARVARNEGLTVLYPVPVRGPVDLGTVEKGVIPLLDTYRPGRHGGTGERFAWTLIPRSARDFVLAGGLDPHNVEEAVRQVAPWGVDASSGLESSPGVKDPAKIRDFIKRAKTS